MKTAVVTGASSGFGLALAEMLCDKGYAVYGLSRRGTGCERAINISCDITDEASVISASGRIAKEKGNISLLVCNAGCGISGSIAETPADDAEMQMRVNFLGAHIAVKSFLPLLKSGSRIVFVSSVAALIPIPYQGFYSASKAALVSYAGALRNELKQSGISVCSVLPGDASTGFTSARKKCGSEGDAAVGRMERDEQNGMSASYVAGKILAACTKKKVRPCFVIGNKYRVLCFLAKLLPASAVSSLVGKLYS